MELRKTFRFEASHVLPKHPGKCSRLHGHSWVLHVSVEGQINRETGFVQDFAEISEVVKPLIERLDHHHLGAWQYFSAPVLPWAIEGLPYDFYPTSENLLWWIAGQLSGLDVWLLKRFTGELKRIDKLHPGSIIPHLEDERPFCTSWWSKLTIEETCTSSATLTRKEYDEKTILHPSTDSIGE